VFLISICHKFQNLQASNVDTISPDRFRWWSRTPPSKPGVNVNRPSRPWPAAPPPMARRWSIRTWARAPDTCTGHASLHQSPPLVRRCIHDRADDAGSEFADAKCAADCRHGPPWTGPVFVRRTPVWCAATSTTVRQARS